jgi:hypothetical protein
VVTGGQNARPWRDECIARSHREGAPCLNNTLHARSVCRHCVCVALWRPCETRIRPEASRHAPPLRGYLCSARGAAEAMVAKSKEVSAMTSGLFLAASFYGKGGSPCSDGQREPVSGIKVAARMTMRLPSPEVPPPPDKCW